MSRTLIYSIRRNTPGRGFRERRLEEQVDQKRPALRRVRGS
jgi:hypothetical protein